MFDFIDRHRRGAFPRVFAPSLPHVPFDAPYTYRKYYEDKDITGIGQALLRQPHLVG